MTGGLPGGQGVIIDVDEGIYGLIIGEQGEDGTCNDVVWWLLGMPPAC